MTNSSLYDERSFYHQFLKDLLACQKEVIIESPFILTKRMKMLYPTFERLVKQGIKDLHLNQRSKRTYRRL
tara:strand:+ start:141 stop:353 length:213 start_codon:yes stop_codon:yes gene_type:complete